MITEDYVSFEVAKLLKEKGFNEYCRTYYPSCNGFIDIYNSPQLIDNKSLFEMGLDISAPTLQMALKWLRKVHNIYLNINIRIILGQWSGYDISVYTTDNNGFLNKNISINLKDNTSYEKACEEAIKYCLTNLI